MTDGSRLWLKCPACRGTGKSNKIITEEGQPPTEEPCPECNGIGFIFYGYMSKDDFPLPDNLPEP